MELVIDGHHMTDEIIDATNQYCGGVAITYHAFRGLEAFEKRYRRLMEGLRCQLNVHLIADKDVAVNLTALMGLQRKLKTRFNLVLLAYYPDVGRASMDRLLTKQVYQNQLPGVIQTSLSLATCLLKDG